ncbi:hypothetical protein HK100_007414 [Physocladia obscura]|uniref:Uncharacterized protein n=1 Tax=Physocladia obscura TaxID=109957 RepID=A0AAD5XB61_9FUNG|nr:hypothetical protein HK100_007414 [Physocladia obscura]
MEPSVNTAISELEHKIAADSPTPPFLPVSSPDLDDLGILLRSSARAQTAGFEQISIEQTRQQNYLLGESSNNSGGESSSIGLLGLSVGKSVGGHQQTRSRKATVSYPVAATVSDPAAEREIERVETAREASKQLVSSNAMLLKYINNLLVAGGK